MIPFIIIYVGGADAVNQGLAQGKVPWGLVGVIVAVVLFLVILTTWLNQRNKKRS
jgi:uncharacterized oligopeptide transporter (OPT) family protein